MLPLLSFSGLAILAGGGWVAYAGPRYFQQPAITEPIAGFLIIAGLGCIGTSLGLCIGPPMH
jgi:hypothetical protein